MPSTTTLTALETELAALFAAMATIAEDCYVPGSGLRMLGLDESAPLALTYDKVDVRSSNLGVMLPVWHAYAFDGIVTAGYDIHQWEVGTGSLEKLGDLLGLFRVEDGYLEDCLLGVGLESLDESTGHLDRLHRRLDARLALDKDWPLSLAQLALLADMNERSVRNATHAEGESRLLMDAGEEVTAKEAKRWLAGRRNFKPTVWRDLAAELGKQPEDLWESEIPLFVRQRLKQVESTWGDYALKQVAWADAIYGEAARRCGLSPERIQAATELPMSIKPQECAALAKLLSVDPAWFTHQVMFALFPEQMDMVLNPKNWVPSAPTTAVDAQPLCSVEVELTRAMLTHGYLDIPSSASELFGTQEFGSKGSEREGAPVELRYGLHTISTDIRLKSARTIAPRKRFTAWFNTELKAKPGDRIRIDKLEDSVFTLTHLPT